MKNGCVSTGGAAAGPPLPSPTLSDDQVRFDLASHGVAFRKDFLEPSTRKALLERVLEQAEMELEQGVAETSQTGTASELGFTGTNGAGAPLQVVSFLPNKGRAFIDLMCDPRLLNYCRHIFSEVPFYVAQVASTIVRKGAAAQVIHTDQQAWPFLTPMPIMINAAIALTDYTSEMGSTHFVTGTKDGPPPKIGKRPDSGRIGNLDEMTTQAATMDAGSLALWTGRIWHGQGASVSDRDRVVILITYVLHMVRAQDNYPALLHDNVYKNLSEEEKRLLGFEVHYEYAGRIAPRAPDDLRRNTNFAYPYVPELRRGDGQCAVMHGDIRIGHADEQAALV